MVRQVAKDKLAALQAMFPEAVRVSKIVMAAMAVARMKLGALATLQRKGLLSEHDLDALRGPLQRVLTDLHHARDTVAMHTAVRESLAHHVYHESCLACMKPRAQRRHHAAATVPQPKAGAPDLEAPADLNPGIGTKI